MTALGSTLEERDMSQSAPILIVGCGQAGAMAAAELRKLGFEGRIVMVGSETHAPYERPPLSKAVLASEAGSVQVALHPEGFYAEHSIEVRLGVEVQSIDTANSVAYCSDGEVLPYASCLIATGGDARVLTTLPAGTPSVHYLRTMDDANGLREAMRTAKDVLVIGGGFLGLEAASTALDQGLRVTLAESNHRLLGRAVPAELADWLEQRVRSRGVDLRLGFEIANIDIGEDGLRFRFADGTTLQPSLVVVAVGLTPRVNLAADAGLALHPANGGIEVNELCQTSQSGVYAAGDCTSQYQPAFGVHMRLESWQNANEQARIAAAAMLGVQTQPAALPWFWTDQFGCNVQMLGAGHPDCTYVWRDASPADADTPKFLLLGTRQGCLCQAIAVNAGGDLRQLRPLVGQVVAQHLQKLANHTIALRPLVRDIQADLVASAPPVAQL